MAGEAPPPGPTPGREREAAGEPGGDGAAHAGGQDVAAPRNGDARVPGDATAHSEEAAADAPASEVRHGSPGDEPPVEGDAGDEDVTVEGLRRLEEDPERQDIIRRMAATRKERLQRALDRND